MSYAIVTMTVRDTAMIGIPPETSVSAIVPIGMTWVPSEDDPSSVAEALAWGYVPISTQRVDRATIYTFRVECPFEVQP